MNLRQTGYLMVGFIIIIGGFLIYIHYQNGNSILSELSSHQSTDWSEHNLKVKVSSALALSSDVSALNVDVSISGSNVVLEGSVRTEQEKINAVRIVSNIENVESVTNRLSVSDVSVSDVLKTSPVAGTPK